MAGEGFLGRNVFLILSANFVPIEVKYSFKIVAIDFHLKLLL